MRLPKKLEGEIRQVYDECMESMFNANLRKYDALLADNFKQIGTTQKEVWFSKKEVLTYLKEYLGPIAGNIELRNRSVRIEAVKELYLITEQADCYVKIDGAWSYYDKCRASSVLQKKGAHWKFIQQHISTPDHRTEEGETIGLKKVHKEITELRNAIKRRTVELENKNRELEIETALEKVRSVAMAMKIPADMLSICKTIAQQLSQLGVKEIRNIQTAVIYKEKGTYVNYEFYAKHNKLLTTEVSYTNHSMSKAFVRKMLEGPNEFFKRSLKGSKVKEWYDFQKKSTNQFADRYLVKANSLNYYWYSLGPVALGISTYQPLSKEEQDLFVRFRNVFELSYRRYLDIQQAEAQAREAEIELALERVRARTMAMHKSQELKEVINIVVEQFGHLHILVEHAGFMLDYKTRDDMHIWLADPNGVPYQVTFPYFDSPHWNSYLEAKEKGSTFFANQLDFKEKNKFYKGLFKLFPVADHAKKFYLSCPGLAISTVLLENIGLYIENFAGTPYTEAENAILMRFGKVFEQAYARFLDLQKAEAQAREAQIEAGLERVRSAALAMRKSDDLHISLTRLFEELDRLQLEIFRCGIAILDPQRPRADVWIMARTNAGNTVQMAGDEPLDTNNTLLNAYRAWKRGDDYEEILEGEVLAEYYRSLNSVGFQAPITELSQHGPQHYFNAVFRHGSLFAFTHGYMSAEARDILRRFAKVLNLAYSRFLDIKVAEEQAREAEIQLALERVRARTMAMQKSEDLNQAAADMFKQIQSLGIQPWGCGFNIFDQDEKAVTQFMSLADGGISPPFRTPLTEDPFFIKIHDARQRGDELLVMESTGESLADTYRYMFSLPGSGEIFGDLEKSGFSMPTFQVTHCAYFAQGYLVFITYKPVPEAHDIFKRFAKVFEQTYTRFLDLQKAEAQAMEAQIELALERVRAKTMAMQKPTEFLEVLNVIGEQFTHLGIDYEWLNFGANGLDISKGIDIWELIHMPGHYHSTTRVFIPYINHTVFNSLTEQFERFRNNGSNFFTLLLDKEDLGKWMDHLYKETTYSEMPADVKAIGYSKSSCASTFIILKDTWLEVGKFDSKHFTDKQNEILRRFSNAFGQAHTRFLDIQKAEAQAREAQVELGLERVRAKAMAMKNSDELNQLIGNVFSELTKLDIALTRCGIWIFDPERLSVQLWLANSEDPLNPASYFLKYHEHEAYQAILKGWKERRQRWVYDLHGIGKKTWDAFLFTETEFSQLPEHVKIGMSAPDRITLTFSFNNFGAIHLSSLEPLSPEHEDILFRFARVFDLTYTRFNDLQKVEAQALETIKRASVDRVRAEIASMRTTGDLARITPLIWNELTTLGVPFIRCGVFIMDEAQQQVHTYLSTPKGEAIAAFHQPYNTPGDIAEVISSWRKKEMYIQHWDEAMFVAFTQQLVQQGAISSGEKYLTENRPKDLYLHFLPFLQGMLYVGNTNALTDEAIQLARNLADAFSTAYARYEDFNKLEAAKQQVDKTLTDLKQAQNQLIQSEKMASLGELTAGIAHEIQNPLNFVNNFSELSKELLDEMSEAIGKGDLQEAREIMRDVIQNLEKINMHGKRADGIVKGMLQHSRASSGHKEPTDINALCEEYLRLAYHGLRAKEKSFNAVLETSFDENVGKVEVAAQDIGRVVLNLINNAFYAVSEKKKLNIEGYEPTVVVTTRKIDNMVMIAVRDNGMGIPEKILDKIFQPFFTTKPTGQGTGLGLSLSYDIVKAHGGELTVNTVENEGTEFIIQLLITA